MNARQRVLRFVLLFAFLGGQWIYAAHSHAEHALDEGSYCELCLHGVQFDSSAPTATPDSITPNAGQSVFVTARINLRATSPRLHDARAPPRI